MRSGFWAAFLFVMLWGSGPVIAWVGLSFSTPFLLLALRSGLAVIIIALILSIKLPFLNIGKRPALTWWHRFHAGGVGLLIHGFYLASVFYAIEHGLSPNLSALITSMQPASTALLALFFLGERIARLSWVGIITGFIGIGIFSLEGIENQTIPGYMFALHFLGMLSLSVGLVWQKKHSLKINLVESTFYQYIGASLLFVVLAFSIETPAVTVTFAFIGALLWLTIGLSIGAIIILLYLMQQQKAARVSSLFFLLPVAAAFFSLVILGQVPSLIEVTGLAIAALGVALVMRPQRDNSDNKDNNVRAA